MVKGRWSKDCELKDGAQEVKIVHDGLRLKLGDGGKERWKDRTVMLGRIKHRTALTTVYVRVATMIRE